MSKRRNEYGQLRKEDYDSIVEQGGGGRRRRSSEQQQGSSIMASEETMKRRRLVRARRPIAAVPVEEPESTSGSASAAVNPFSSIKLAAAAPSAAPRPNKVSFSFGTSGAPVAAPKPATTSVPASVPVANQSAKLEELYQALRAAVQKAPASASYLSMLHDYLGYYNVLCPPKPPPVELASPAPVKTSATPVAATAAPSAPAPAPSAPSFGNFASTASSAAPTSNNKPPTFIAFPPAPAPAPASAAAPDKTNQEEANNEEANSSVVAQVDPDWDDVAVFDNVKFYRYDEDSRSWNTFVKGKLRLQTNKNDPSQARMVMRDDIGLKVLINMLVPDGTTFQLEERTKNKLKIGDVTFSGKNDAAIGREMFRMASVLETAKQLHAKLKELAKT